MIRLEFYVEEPSAEAALINLVPLILRDTDFEFEIYPFQGKQALLRKLPHRLKAYHHFTDSDWRVVVLVDRDDDDCHQLKASLERIAREAGLHTRTSTGSASNFQVLNRMAIEELEAWFFGDIPALRKAYPQVPSTLDKKAAYRNPDAITGGTWEQLERVLKTYHPGGLEKVRAAEEISEHMDPDRNRSKSFQVFRDALRAILE